MATCNTHAPSTLQRRTSFAACASMSTYHARRRRLSGVFCCGGWWWKMYPSPRCGGHAQMCADTKPRSRTHARYAHMSSWYTGVRACSGRRYRTESRYAMYTCRRQWRAQEQAQLKQRQCHLWECETGCDQRAPRKEVMPRQGRNMRVLGHKMPQDATRRDAKSEHDGKGGRNTTSPTATNET